MQKLLVLAVAAGFAVSFLHANDLQFKKYYPASSDTTVTRDNKNQKQVPKQKLKINSSSKKDTVPAKLDSFKIKTDTPLLRQKDSSQNNSR
jgi:hypothetical protein